MPPIFENGFLLGFLRAPVATRTQVATSSMELGGGSNLKSGGGVWGLLWMFHKPDQARKILHLGLSISLDSRCTLEWLQAVGEPHRIGAERDSGVQ